MKCSFAKDPNCSQVVFDLLEVVFPGIQHSARRARALGATWESVSTPFLHFEDGRAVAHIGVIELSLLLRGEIVRVGSVHAVATHPDFRRRGLYRKLMDELVNDTATRYETLILSTENPEYYEPFGFRALQEHCFVVRRNWPRGTNALRLLNTQDQRDVTLLQRLLSTREPLSSVAGVVGDRAVFCFNEGGRALQYAEDLDVILCMEQNGSRLELFDIVGPALPTLDELVKRVPEPIEEIVTCFVPDRLAADDARATPYVLDHDGPSHLMVRGPFPVEGEPFTLPRSART